MAYPYYYMPEQKNSILWVQGLNGAKSFMVAPNTTVLLMDSEASVFYIKSADSSGMPMLRTFDYAERTAEPIADYVTRKEFAEMQAKLESILKGENNA